MAGVEVRTHAVVGVRLPSGSSYQPTRRRPSADGAAVRAGTPAQCAGV